MRKSCRNYDIKPVEEATEKRYLFEAQSMQAFDLPYLSLQFIKKNNWLDVCFEISIRRYILRYIARRFKPRCLRNLFLDQHGKIYPLIF